MPDANGRIRGISIPSVPWHDVPVTPEEDEAFFSLRAARDLQLAREDRLAAMVTGPVSDESIHQALCVEEGCARCAR